MSVLFDQVPAREREHQNKAIMRWMPGIEKCKCTVYAVMMI
jgi:hypothetical protein